MQEALYFRVQSVMLSRERSALTLSPVEWVKKDPDGPQDPDEAEWIDANPTDPGAEPLEPSGKLTELRVDYRTECVPGEFLTLTIAPTEHHWQP